MSFKLKLIISISLLIAITFGIGGALLISTSFQAALYEQKKSAMNSYETVRDTLYLLNSLGDKTDYNTMTDALKQMERQGTISWQTLQLKTDSKYVFQSGDISLLSDDLPVPDSGQCSYVVLSDDAGDCIQILSTISSKEQQLFLQARFDLSSAYETRDTQQKLYFITYIAVVLLGFIIATILSFALTKKLGKLTATVRKIASGDLSKRSNIRTYDEIGQLSRDFDVMADKLQKNIDRLEDDMRRQESFMGAFAHELKTPMTSIIGYADLLRQGGMDENDSIAAANYIFSEGKRLEKLSFKLLDLLLMEKDSFQMKEINLSYIIEDVERAFSHGLKNTNIKLIFRSDSGKVILEPDLVKSLIYNLIDNAEKSIEGTGTIMVIGELMDKGCKIHVIDNGRGMEEYELSRITEAFYRIDKSRSRKQGGAGLGLALCKKIADLHSGNIKFVSGLGKGTCVTVELYGKEGKNNEKT